MNKTAGLFCCHLGHPGHASDHAQALSRLHSLQRTLNKNPETVSCLYGLFKNRHAEEAPPLSENTEHWYLPFLRVFHPQKPDQIRVVFDSSAPESGILMNSVLLSGPDLNNSLLRVLLRFRKELIALTAYIQQLIYCFLVREDHRNYLRFLWHKDNDLEKEVTEYHVCARVWE